jgi:hypothetical protein
MNDSAAANHSAAHTRLARSIARLHGFDEQELLVSVSPEGAVCVRGHGHVALYPPEAWWSRFTRHLLQGLFRTSVAMA